MHWRDAGIALKSRSLNRIHRVANRQAAIASRVKARGGTWRFLQCAKEYNWHR
jgi:hypothetical protein